MEDGRLFNQPRENLVEVVGFEPTLRFLSLIQSQVPCQLGYTSMFVVPLGFEPRLRESKSLVLPLHYKTIKKPEPIRLIRV